MTSHNFNELSSFAHVLCSGKSDTLWLGLLKLFCRTFLDKHMLFYDKRWGLVQLLIRGYFLKDVIRFALCELDSWRDSSSRATIAVIQMSINFFVIGRHL